MPFTTRRRFLTSATAALAGLTAGPLAAQSLPGSLDLERRAGSAARRNTASFRSVDWRDHFASLRDGAILVDIDSRVLHLWQPDGAYRLYPSSVPQSEEMTRRGRTRIVRKVVGPDWRPTPNMRRRNPEWPAYVPPGPDNPLGTHALYLGWTYYRIHGTHDPRKIGRRSSSGCIGLYNQHIADVFDRTRVGTQVLLI